MSLGLYLSLGLYTLGLFALGLYFFVTTESNQLSDYLLGGREISTWPMALSEVASVASGFVFFAWVGVGYSIGLAGLWFAVALSLVYLFTYRFIGPKFRQQSEDLDSYTVVDHLSKYFHDGWSNWIRIVGVITIIIFLVSYIGAQLIAVGGALTTGADINYNVGIFIGGLAVASYVLLGGFNASIWTDAIQGILIAVTAIALPIIMIMEIGGWTVFVTETRTIDPALLSGTSDFDVISFLLFSLGYYAFAMGAIGQPHGLMRFQSIKSEKLISGASVIAMSVQFLRNTFPLFIGLAGRILYEDIGNPENVGILALTDLLPGWIAGLLLAGILGAILSTSDSMMIVISSDVVELYREYIGANASNDSMVLVSRVVIVTLSFVGIFLAYLQPATIFDIIQFAYVGLGASLGVPLVGILLWEQTTSGAVLLTMVTGLLSTVGNAIYLPAYDPILVWPITIGVLIVTSYITSRNSSKRAHTAG